MGKPNRKNIQLGDDLKDSKIVVTGKDLQVEWLGDFLLVWSKKDHPYRK